MNIRKACPGYQLGGGDTTQSVHPQNVSMCTSFVYGLSKQKGARSAEQSVQSSNHVQTNIRCHVCLCFDIRSIHQDGPFMQILSKHSVLSKPVLRPFFLETNVYCLLPLFFLFTLTIFRAQRGNFFNVYFLFLWIA